MRNVRGLAVAALLAVSTTGCVKKMLLSEQIQSARSAAAAADTIADYELARSAAAAEVERVEGMHRLAPDDEDALLLLLRGWTRWCHDFVEDDRDVARLAGDGTNVEYHQKRAKLAYDRAIFYGLELLAHEDDGLAAAKKSQATLKAWLEKHFDEKEDAEPLFWLGSAWLARARLLGDDPEAFVGAAMLERSFALRPELMAWGAASALGVYHARSPKAELDEAKTLLDLAVEKTKRRSLGVLFDYAMYACARSDQVLYERTLNEILAAEDTDPNLRLPNVVAKRRAKRALGKDAMAACGFGRSPAAPPGAR